MHKALKAMLYGGSVLAVVAVGLASWEGLLAPQSVADPLVKHDVRIVRDSWGVPHIFGKTDADVAYGLAYAHAEDDFGTIAETLAMVRGRAGAMIGPGGATFDWRAKGAAARYHPRACRTRRGAHRLAAVAAAR